MDDNARRWFLFFIVALIAVQMFLFQGMKKRPQQPGKPGTTQSPQGPGAAQSSAASQPGQEHRAAPPATLTEEEPGEKVVVRTDVYEVTFDSAGAYPTSWKIIDPAFAKASQTDVEEGRAHGLKVGDHLPIELIPDYTGLDKGRDYPLMVVLKETDGPFHEDFNRRHYTVDGPREEGKDTTVVSFTHRTSEGLELVKTFRFSRNSYLTDMTITLGNAPESKTVDFSETGQPGMGLIWGPGIGDPKIASSWDKVAYMAAAYDGTSIVSRNFSNWDKVRTGTPMEQAWEGGSKWGVLESRFFMAAIIPTDGPAPLVHGVVKRQHAPMSDALCKIMSPPVTTEVYSGKFLLAPGASKTLRYRLFVGPKQRQALMKIDKETGYDLHKVMFHDMYRINRMLATFMLGILNWLHAHTHNYGVSIILLTLFMRLLTQPFTHIGMKSQARVMAEQQRIKPLIDAINEKYKDDPQKKNAEVWKTYREHGVNPLGAMKGCIWMLIQIPIFIALYKLLLYAIDLRGEGFLWIKDLTAPDALFTFPFRLPIIGTKFNILPIVMGLSQVFAQRLQNTNLQDPNQKMMATVMPIMFIFMLYNFAAGLSLYWFVSNVWQISFQLLVNKKVKEEAERKAHKAFEARQQAIQQGLPLQKKDPNKKPTWRDKLVSYLEAKSKEAEKMKKGK
jgi:YidC/Oxa1 family membrane protein insertase